MSNRVIDPSKPDVLLRLATPDIDTVSKMYEAFFQGPISDVEIARYRAITGCLAVAFGVAMQSAVMPKIRMDKLSAKELSFAQWLTEGYGLTINIKGIFNA